MATNRQEGFFQRNLPKMGFALNTVTSVASGVVDLVAERIVSKSAGAGLAAGVLGTVSGIVVNWLIFLFSNVQGLRLRNSRPDAKLRARVPEP